MSASADPELENTSDSVGLPFTADLMLVVTQSEDLAKVNQYLFKQLKNRYDDLGKFRKFTVGVEKAKMKLFDVDQAKAGVQSDGAPIMDTSHLSPNEREDIFNAKFLGFGDARKYM
jgi:hypothetical protein